MHKVPLDTVVGEIEISYKTQIRISSRPVLNRVEDVYRVCLATWDMHKIELQEQFKVLLLNRANRLLGICTLTTGNASGTIADPKQVFAVALRANATCIIIVHNHPSGNIQPSKADQELTQRMRLAGEVLELKLLDHLIITVEGYYSFAEDGVL